MILCRIAMAISGPVSFRQVSLIFSVKKLVCFITLWSRRSVISQFLQNSMKFCGNIKIPWKRQILWLGSKFCDPQKTVGP